MQATLPSRHHIRHGVKLILHIECDTKKKERSPNLNSVPLARVITNLSQHFSSLRKQTPFLPLGIRPPDERKRPSPSERKGVCFRRLTFFRRRHNTEKTDPATPTVLRRPNPHSEVSVRDFFIKEETPFGVLRMRLMETLQQKMKTKKKSYLTL